MPTNLKANTKEQRLCSVVLVPAQTIHAPKTN